MAESKEQFDAKKRYPNKGEETDPQEYYLRTTLHHGEDGSEMSFNTTPGNRAVTIRHAAGTLIQIVDDGSLKQRVEGTTEQTLKKGLHLLISKGEDDDAFTIHVREGNAKLTFKGDVRIEGKNIDFTSTNDFNLKVGGAFRTEVSGDWGIQVNGALKQKVDGDNFEVVGGTYHQLVKEKTFVTSRGDYNLDVGEDALLAIGGEAQMSASGTLGLSGLEASLSAVETVTVNSSDGQVDIHAPSLITVESTGGDVTVEAASTIKNKVSSTGIQIEDGKVSVTKVAHIGVDDLGGNAPNDSPPTHFP